MLNVYSRGEVSGDGAAPGGVEAEALPEPLASILDPVLNQPMLKPMLKPITAPLQHLPIVGETGTGLGLWGTDVTSQNEPDIAASPPATPPTGGENLAAAENDSLESPLSLPFESQHGVPFMNSLSGHIGSSQHLAGLPLPAAIGGGADRLFGGLPFSAIPGYNGRSPFPEGIFPGSPLTLPSRFPIPTISDPSAIW